MSFSLRCREEKNPPRYKWQISGGTTCSNNGPVRGWQKYPFRRSQRLQDHGDRGDCLCKRSRKRFERVQEAFLLYNAGRQASAPSDCAGEYADSGRFETGTRSKQRRKRTNSKSASLTTSNDVVYFVILDVALTYYCSVPYTKKYPFEQKFHLAVLLQLLLIKYCLQYWLRDHVSLKKYTGFERCFIIKLQNAAVIYYRNILHIL